MFCFVLPGYRYYFTSSIAGRMVIAGCMEKSFLLTLHFDLWKFCEHIHFIIIIFSLTTLWLDVFIPNLQFIAHSTGMVRLIWSSAYSLVLWIRY